MNLNYTDLLALASFPDQYFSNFWLLVCDQN